MSTSKKWSEQALIEQPLMKHDENGNDVQDGTERTLYVCVNGMELFKKAFVNDKYEGKNELLLPFDFVVLAGDMCPEGKFYELDYFLGERGMVYRALIQAVNPVTDLPLIVETLRHRNVLPKEFNPQKAFLRDDIDAVRIGNCSRDKKEPVFFAGVNRVGLDKQSIKDYSIAYHGACLEYYRGDCREVWITKPAAMTEYDPIFVCGSDNVNDTAFADQRKADLEEMEEHLNDAMAIADMYNLPYILSFDKGVTENEKRLCSTSVNVEKNFLVAFRDLIDKFIAEADSQQ